MTTSYEMAPPPTPITILLLHLQVLYDVIILTFIIATSLFPSGTCTQYTDIWRGTRWTTQLLYGHEARLVSLTHKKGVAIEAWRQRGSLESLTKVNHVLCEAESEAESGALPNNRLNYRFN